jgi:hypothetical protein
VDSSSVIVRAIARRSPARIAAQTLEMEST